MEQITLTEEQQRSNKAKKTMLYLAMASFTMMFAGLTSAYVVSESRPDWLRDFTLPSAFTISTVIILLSSVSFHLALKAIKNNERSKTTSLLLVTLALGIAFIVCQFVGFGQIIDQGYYFTGSESTITTSFLYVVVIVHIGHLIGGLIALLTVIYNHFKQKYFKGQTFGIELATIFWHFLDFLWLYLFLFFTFYK
ncbi:heme-copper oxidase subunit III [Capnocytophaga sp. ARDL2]|uniref:cytochrome c oxidase subunit 3 n=1 Tax=Capnocytophaga sp. ARDL2 TaxID=3238809 RepID=UPI003559324B